MLKTLTQALEQHSPVLHPPNTRPQASVALILHEVGSDFELFFIERASHPNDPWSGHIAFPGGHLDRDDPSIQATAERETYEEVGLMLNQEIYLGRLDDLLGLVGSVQVAGFVYQLASLSCLKLNPEVERAFWVPLADLVDTKVQTLHQVKLKTDQSVFPALKLLGPQHPLLWGLTYRFVAQLVGFCGYQLPLQVSTQII